MRPPGRVLHDDVGTTNAGGKRGPDLMSSRIRKRMALLAQAGLGERGDGQERSDTTLIRGERAFFAQAKEHFLAKIGASKIRYIRAGFPDPGWAVLVPGQGFLTASSPFSDQIIPVTFRMSVTAESIAKVIRGRVIQAPYDMPLVDGELFLGPCNINNRGEKVDIRAQLKHSTTDARPTV